MTCARLPSRIGRHDRIKGLPEHPATDTATQS
jgi:hypothetical protein